MTRKQFYLNLHKAVKDGVSRIVKARNELAKTMEEMKNDMYSREYIENTLEPRRREAVRKIEQESDKAKEAAYALLDEYIIQLEDEDALNGADINDDLKLLTCGMKLSKKDLLDMVKRNENNRTMTQMIIRYAEDNGVDIGIVYRGNKGLIETVKQLKANVDYAIKWTEYPKVNDMVERVWGEGTQMFNYFVLTSEDDIDVATPVDEEARAEMRREGWTAGLDGIDVVR